MIHFSSEERQYGGAYIGASEKLVPCQENRSLAEASREDLEMECRREKTVIGNYHRRGKTSWKRSYNPPWEKKVENGGNKWRSRRRFLNACFRKDILKEYVPIINEKSRILVESLKKETREDFTNISKPISKCMTNILNEVLFGLHKAENQCELRDFIYALKWGMRFIAERIMNVFLWPDFIYFSTKRGRELKKYAKAVKDFTRSRIQQRKQKHLQRDFSAREAKGRPLLDLLLEYHLERTDFTENDLSDELITFMTAGQDSTTAAISWTLYMLGLYQDIQAKVHEELDLIFCEDTERHVTLEELNKMKYLKSVIKETLRLYPPSPFLARQVHEDVNIFLVQLYTVLSHNQNRPTSMSDLKEGCRSSVDRTGDLSDPSLSFHHQENRALARFRPLPENLSRSSLFNPPLLPTRGAVKSLSTNHRQFCRWSLFQRTIIGSLPFDTFPVASGFSGWR
ncbi:Cytochrome P450 4V2 [Araneus ventricosus]|uniref:Cytochrome P450 4V2 n=1 Tax=Araneus ventricosus TaxID=182803 RepID=A0A4Y2H7V6_ARAVE|nr:Cytochrome P450 4V2 [Araneus ventricosus]